jgi:hypothetical protein
VIKGKDEISMRIWEGILQKCQQKKKERKEVHHRK